VSIGASLPRIGAALSALLCLAAPALAGSDPPQTLYLLRCSGCHGVDGGGSKIGRVPGLAGFNKLLLHPDGRLFLANVPGIKNSGLSDDDVARLLNWALDHWGDKSVADAGPALTGAEIGPLRHTRVDDLAALRAHIVADLAAQGIDIGSYGGN
jgi:hypothetical protein